jgi:peptide/nickel transport system substrate-binding protein
MIRLQLASTLLHLILLTAGFAISACSPSGDPASSIAPPRTLRLSQGSDVRSMDPYLQLESPTFCVLINIFDALTDISPAMELAPSLATEWRNVEPTVWELTLREGVRFHDGGSFDAEDVRYSLDRARNWPLSRLASELPTYVRTEIVDPHRVRLHTTTPDAILPRRLASVMIVDKESSEAAGDERGEEYLTANPNGTGPYRLDRWTPGESVALASNLDYWGGAPAIERIEFRAVEGDAARVAAFVRGEIDLMSQAPVRDAERLRGVAGARVIENPGLRLIYLGFDVGRDASPGVPGSPPNPLRDLRVRRAIAAAVNEDLIVEKIMNGLARPAAQLFPEGVIGHDAAAERPRHDPDAARALLAEAGYADGFDVRLDAPNDRYVNDAAIAAAVAADLAKVGVRVEVNAQTKSRFFALEEAGESSFFLLGWTNANGDGAPTFDHLLHTRAPELGLGGANASSNYSNPELDRRVRASAGEFDPAARARLLQEANRIAMDDLVHLPLHFQADLYAVSDRVEWTPRRDTQLRGIEMKWKESAGPQGR